MANFRSRFVNMAGTHWSRRIPSHSDLNKISKGTPPDASLTHCLDVVGKGRRCAARVPAERSAPARGSTTHGCEGKTAPGGLPHQTHLLSEVPRCANQACPRGVSVQEPPPASAHEVDGHVSVIMLHTPGLQASPVPAQ